jgi:RimJ/RimL family protein N-acetyltransferase
MGDAAARYIIPTARTSLRPVSMEDVEALHRLWTDPEVRRFFWDDEVIPHERAEAAVREAVEDFGRHGFGLWISERAQGGGAPVGFCGLRYLDDGPEVEILYGISPPEWGGASPPSSRWRRSATASSGPASPVYWASPTPRTSPPAACWRRLA